VGPKTEAIQYPNYVQQDPNRTNGQVERPIYSNMLNKKTSSSCSISKPFREPLAKKVIESSNFAEEKDSISASKISDTNSKRIFKSIG
jgi:hypothetical protein